VAQLGVCFGDASVYLTAKNDSAAYSSADCDENEISGTVGSTPLVLCERRRIRVVLNRHRDTEFFYQLSDKITAGPAWQSADIADDAAKGIERARACNANTVESAASIDGLMQHQVNTVHRVWESARGIG
jgi:hypothetical protein